MRNLKDDLEFKREFLEWERLYLKLKQMILKKNANDPLTWGPALKKLEEAWEKIQKNLTALYKQPKVELSKMIENEEIAAEELPF